MNARRRAKGDELKLSNNLNEDGEEKSKELPATKFLMILAVLILMKLFVHVPYAEQTQQEIESFKTSTSNVEMTSLNTIQNPPLSQPQKQQNPPQPPQQQIDHIDKHSLVSSDHDKIIKESMHTNINVHTTSETIMKNNKLNNNQNENHNEMILDEELWNKALGASVVRGKQKDSGVVIARLASYESKRKGPRRHDGKSFKAGEAGCPSSPIFKKLDGGKLTKGDKRLKTIHFVHPPKSGGTTFGQVVISSACELNKQYKDSLDCCSDPHDWCGENCEPIPECQAVFGCTLCDCHHIPRLNRMEDATYSVTIIRHPMTRYISGYFYRAHSPNWDRFNLRPGYFSKDPTYPFKFSFNDYLKMPEYHNIIIKMFSKDKFPYFNSTLNSKDVIKTKQILSKFVIVGINEAYDASVQMMLKIFNIKLKDEQIHLPAAMTSTYSKDHEEFKNNLRNNNNKESIKLANEIFNVNKLDVDVYQWSVNIFCEKLCHFQLMEFDKRSVCDCT